MCRRNQKALKERAWSWESNQKGEGIWREGLGLARVRGDDRGLRILRSFLLWRRVHLYLACRLTTKCPTQTYSHQAHF